MMYHTRAIILKKEEWREADWLVTALTADFGKIRLLAQGSRRHGAKLQGHLEPGSVSGISFVIGRNGYRLTTARLYNFFPGIRNSLLKCKALAIIIKLLDDNLFEDANRANDILIATTDVLSALDNAESALKVKRLTTWFHVRLLYLLGLLPSLLSIEGGGIKTLLSMAECTVFQLDNREWPEEICGKELSQLIKKLSGAVIADSEAVTVMDYAL